MVKLYYSLKEILNASKARSYARSKTQIENEKRRFSIWIFRSKKKNCLMRSDFGDFRAAFFDLAFSIATSYRNGGDFRSEKWRSNNTARLDTKACARPTNKNCDSIGRRVLET